MRIEVRSHITSKAAKLAAHGRRSSPGCGKFHRIAFAMCLPILLALGLTQADQVYAALNATETTETTIGTITIPTSGVSRIVGVYGIIMQPTLTSGETISGSFRLAFTTVSGKFKFPAQAAGGMVTTANWNSVDPKIIPVNIPVPTNETVTCYMTANKALTGTGEGLVGLIME